MANNKDIVKVFPYYFPIGEHQNVSICTVAKTYIKHSKYADRFLVLSPQCDYTDKTTYHEDNIEVHYILPDKNNTYTPPKERTPLGNWSLSNTRISQSYYLQEVIKKIKTINPKLIEVENDPKLAGILGKVFRNKIPVIFIPHTPVGKNKLMRNLSFYWRYIRHIKQIIFVSYSHYNHFRKNFFFAKKATKVIHNSYAHLPQHNIDFNNKLNQIIFAGRAGFEKGYREYILGVLPILNKYPSWKALAVLAVETNKDVNELNNFLDNTCIQKAIKDNKLEIIYNLPNHQVFKKLLESKIAIFPTHFSWIEGLPLVGIEALYAKCVLITSLNPGFQELCSDHAIYLNSIDADNVTQKIELLINNPELLQKLSNDGYNHLVENFNIDNLITQYDKVRKKLLS